MSRRRDTERNRNGRGEQQPAQRQLERSRQSARDFLHHRLTGGERLAEIATREIAQVEAELVDERFVEAQMAAMNRKLHPGVETVFLLPQAELQCTSSTLVREIATLGGDVSAMVSPSVAARLTAPTLKA